MCFWNIFLYLAKYLLIHLHSRLTEWFHSFSSLHAALARSVQSFGMGIGSNVFPVFSIHANTHLIVQTHAEKISLLHTPGTLGLLIWPSVHMTEDHSSLQRCVAHKQNSDCSLNYSHSARDLMLLIFLGGTSGIQRKKRLLKILKGEKRTLN